MLPRRQKLSRRSFPTQHDPKTTWRGVVLLLRFTKTKETTPPRFAVVVSKKQLKLATERNKMRRLIYLTIREHLGGFSRFLGARFIITTQKSDHNAIKRDVIESDIKNFLSQ